MPAKKNMNIFTIFLNSNADLASVLKNQSESVYWFFESKEFIFDENIIINKMLRYISLFMKSSLTWGITNKLWVSRWVFGKEKTMPALYFSLLPYIHYWALDWAMWFGNLCCKAKWPSNKKASRDRGFFIFITYLAHSGWERSITWVPSTR